MNWNDFSSFMAAHKHLVYAAYGMLSTGAVWVAKEIYANWSDIKASYPFVSTNSGVTGIIWAYLFGKKQTIPALDQIINKPAVK